MDNTAKDELKVQTSDDTGMLNKAHTPTKAKIVELNCENRERDPHCEHLVNALNAWVRHPLARNRFW